MEKEETIMNKNAERWDSILSAVSSPEAFSSQELRSNIKKLLEIEFVDVEENEFSYKSFFDSLVNKLNAALPASLFPVYEDAKTKIALNPEVYKKAEKYFAALWLAAVFSSETAENENAKTFANKFFYVANTHLTDVLCKELFSDGIAPTFSDLNEKLEQPWPDILKNTPNVVDLQEEASSSNGKEKRKKARSKSGAQIAEIEGQPAGELSPRPSRPGTQAPRDIPTIRKSPSTIRDDQVIDAWLAIATQTRDQLLLSQGRVEETKLILRVFNRMMTYLSTFSAIISNGKFGVRGDKELERSEKLVSDIEAIKNRPETITERKAETPEKSIQSPLKQVEEKVLNDLESSAWRANDTRPHSLKEASFHGNMFKVLCPEKNDTADDSTHASVLKEHYGFDLGKRPSLYETKVSKFRGFFSKVGISPKSTHWNPESAKAKGEVLFSALSSPSHF